MTIFSINSGSFGDVTITGIISASVIKGDGSQITSVSYDNIASKPTLLSSSTQVTSLLPEGTFSSSAQVDITDTTGYSTFSSSFATTDTTQATRLTSIENITGSYATTGSNTFVGVQNINNTTNSNLYTDGAMVIAGGLGVAKDVNISGSLTIIGLLTAVSSAVQYITASQVDIGNNIIALNTDVPAVRYGGISVVDSGSVGVSASLLYDSYTNNWVFKHKDEGEETEDFSNVLFGPVGTGPDNIPVLVGNYITKVENDGHGHHITTSSITDDGILVNIGTKLNVVGSTTASAFKGDGSQLTNVGYENIASKPTLVSASSQVSYTGLSNIPGGIVSSSAQQVVSTYTNGTDNRVLTSTGTSGINGESNLTFDGNIFAVNTNNLYVSGGSVGIGTTSPVNSLHVYGDGVTSQGVLKIENTKNAGGVYFPAARFINTRGNHSYGIVAEFSNATGGDSDRPSILFYGAQNAHSWQVGQVTSGWGTNDAFGIGYRASNTPSSFNSWPTTNYFTILTSGNVGIGTTSPTARLTVKPTSANAAVFNVQAATTTNNLFNLISNDTDGHCIIDLARNSESGTYSPAYIRLRTDGDSWIQGGNVGIGTTNPSSFKLQVNGSIGPQSNGTYDLGSSSLRWSTVYTSDLSLSNGIGDWTIVEGEDDLFIYNNKKNKVYKFNLQEVDPSTATPKKS